jgi:hypothetical protein
MKYVLDLRAFVFNKLPEDGTLMPKHVAVDAWYDVIYAVFYCILRSAFCWLKYGIRVLIYLSASIDEIKELSSLPISFCFSFFYGINLLKPSGFFTYHQV